MQEREYIESRYQNGHTTPSHGLPACDKLVGFLSSQSPIHKHRAVRNKTSSKSGRLTVSWRGAKPGVKISTVDVFLHHNGII